MRKRLYRSDSDRMIWGVCGGLADYFDLDPVIFRIAFVLLAFANGLGILGYILMSIFIPRESKAPSQPPRTAGEVVSAMGETARELGGELKERVEASGVAREGHTSGMLVVGIILIVFGLLFLLSNFNVFWWFRWARLWPLLLVALGLVLLLRKRR